MSRTLFLYLRLRVFYSILLFTKNLISKHCYPYTSVQSWCRHTHTTCYTAVPIHSLYIFLYVHSEKKIGPVCKCVRKRNLTPPHFHLNGTIYITFVPWILFFFSFIFTTWYVSCVQSCVCDMIRNKEKSTQRNTTFFEQPESQKSMHSLLHFFYFHLCTHPTWPELLCW